MSTVYTMSTVSTVSKVSIVNTMSTVCTLCTVSTVNTMSTVCTVNTVSTAHSKIRGLFQFQGKYWQILMNLRMSHIYTLVLKETLTNIYLIFLSFLKCWVCLNLTKIDVTDGNMRTYLNQPRDNIPLMHLA